MAKIHVTTTINGAPTEYLCDPNQTLLDVLRDNLGLTGSKEGCGSGDCGACSVMIDDRLVCSCLVLAPEAEGAEDRDDRGHGRRRQAASAAEEVRRDGRAPVRHLHAGLPDRLQGAARQEPRTRPRRRSATGWPATSAAAPATTRSSRAVMDVAAEMRGASQMSQSHEKSEASAKYKWIGTRPDRPDGADKVTGRARFGADFNLPGQLIGKVLRSPHPHAIIESIDTSKAEALAGREGRGDVEGLPRAGQPDRADRRDAGEPARRHAQRHGAREGALRGPSGRRRRRRPARRSPRQALGADQGRVQGPAARDRRRRGDEARRAGAARQHDHRGRHPAADQAVATSPSASSSTRATPRRASPRPRS